MTSFFKSAFIIFLLFLPILYSGCGGDKEAGLPPVIDSVLPDSAGMGDTVIVEGDRFNPTPLKNRIAFFPGEVAGEAIAMYAVPFEGDRGVLKAVVPDGVFTGSLRAEQISPIAGFIPFSGGDIFISTALLPFYVEFKKGDVGKGFFCSENFNFPLTSGGETRHMMILFSNSPSPSDLSVNYSYSIEFEAATGDAAAAASKKKKVYGDKRSEGVSNGYRDIEVSGFDKKKREETAELLKSGGAELSYGPEKGRSFSPVRGVPATAEFDVYSEYEGSTFDTNSYTTVVADLKYEGNHTLLYLDISTDPGCVTDLEIVSLGQEFEQSVYQIDRESYGEESDINGDGKVAILMSPVINELTPGGQDWYITGFFLPVDLLPSLVNPRCTNGMEIFYTVVPDPGGIYGYVLPKEEALEAVAGVLGHEFLHMIMFNYRILKYGGGASALYMEELWLEEGLAHIAEYLNEHYANNIGRVNEYFADPGNASLVYGDDTIARRGAAFLFLRYLGDRYGDIIFRELVQSKKSGVENIENVTGERFIDLFADWTAALYLNIRGIECDERFKYSSLDLAADFEPLNISGITSAVFPAEGDLRALAPEFIELNFTNETSLDVFIESDDHASMNTVIIRR
ncbi:MAG: hypothetical protein U5O15_01490 [Candidatus Krumholzibacteriota bacterium]|nr:hypothetical protein [Candidatus Krumholzibacteriota bacterium]